MLFHIERIEIGNTALSVTIDEKFNLHLLDLDEEGRKTLTNAIDAGFQLKVLEKIKDISVKNWVLYHTDGYVTKWNGHFEHVPHTDSMLYQPFKAVAAERKKNCS